jgi:hypothetical protein
MDSHSLFLCWQCVFFLFLYTIAVAAGENVCVVWGGKERKIKFIMSEFQRDRFNINFPSFLTYVHVCVFQFFLSHVRLCVMCAAQLPYHFKKVFNVISTAFFLS